MEKLDGWAVTVGDETCRFFSRNGHDGLRGLFCSDGYYSAGWKVLGASVALVFVGFILARLLKTSH